MTAMKYYSSLKQTDFLQHSHQLHSLEASYTTADINRVYISVQFCYTWPAQKFLKIFRSDKRNYIYIATISVGIP
jgi:hypothetical protein